MPIYEYECKLCGERFEVVQSINDRPLRLHETCGGPLQKVYHPAGIIFKGSGFYSTDSRRAKQGKSRAESKEAKGAEKEE